MDDSSSSAAAAAAAVNKQKRRRGKRRDEPQPDVAKDTETIAKSDTTTSGEDVIPEKNISIERPPLQPLDLRLNRINKDTIDYFKNIERLLLDTEQDHTDLLEKVFEEVDGKEIALSADYGTSRIMEQLLNMSTDFQLRVFFDRLRGSFPQLFMHQFASHVIQTMLVQCSKRFATPDNATSAVEAAGELMPLKELFLEMCAELDGYWPALMADTYGSHLLRIILFILSGSPLAVAEIKSKASQSYAANHQLLPDKNTAMAVADGDARIKVPKEFSDRLAEITSALINGITDSQVRSMAVNLVASHVLQILLQVIPQGLADSLIDRLLMNVSQSQVLNESMLRQRQQFVQSFMQDQVGSHLFERMLKAMSAEMFALVYQQFFAGRLLRLAQHPFANYVVQSMMDNVKAGSQLETMIKELSVDLGSLLFKGKANVVLKAMDSAMRLATGYEAVKQSLVEAFEIDHKQPVHSLRCFLFLRPLSQQIQAASGDESHHAKSNNFRKQNNRYHVVGSQLVQKMLLFPESCNIFLVSSLFAQPAEEWLTMASDPVASRALEAFFTSPTVGAKVKRKIVRQLDGKFVDLAQNKYACHLVDRCWAVSEIKQKESIADELCRGEQTLASSTYGRLILRNCRIEQFKRRKSDWVAYEVGKTKKREVFREFLDGSVLAQNKRIKLDVVVEKTEIVEMQSTVAIPPREMKAEPSISDSVMSDVLAAIADSGPSNGRLKAKKVKKKVRSKE